MSGVVVVGGGRVRATDLGCVWNIETVDTLSSGEHCHFSIMYHRRPRLFPRAQQHSQLTINTEVSKANLEPKWNPQTLSQDLVLLKSAATLPTYEQLTKKYGQPRAEIEFADNESGPDFSKSAAALPTYDQLTRQ